MSDAREAREPSEARFVAANCTQHKLKTAKTTSTKKVTKYKLSHFTEHKQKASPKTYGKYSHKRAENKHIKHAKTEHINPVK